MNIIDISSDLLTAKVYPGDPEPRLQLVNRLDCDDDFNVSAIYSSLHTGTHVDAPLHVFEDGQSIDEMTLEKFIGPVTIVSLPHGPITGEVVEKYFPKTAKKIILRVHSDSEFFAGAAEDIAEIGYELIGYDQNSIGGQDECGAHRALLSSGATLLEGLDLSSVEHDGEYFLMAQPIKLVGREAAFVRAVLIDDYIFWSSKQA